MENTSIRSNCFLPFDKGWEQPTAEEVRDIMRITKLSGSAAAKLLGIKEGRTIRRWTSGESAIPYAAWAILCERAGFGLIWYERQEKI